MLFSKKPNINDLVEEYKTLPHAMLVDVREPDEYRSGHIKGAVNAPLSALDSFSGKWDKDTKLYVYCLSGARSGRAVKFLESSGFKDVRNIGGINSYTGEIE